MLFHILLHYDLLQDIEYSFLCYKIGPCFYFMYIYCSCLDAESCPTLWEPMDCSTPGFPIHHYFPGLLELMFTESVMSSNHLTLCRPLLFLPSIFPSIRVFSNESAFHIRWPKYWSSIAFLIILPSNPRTWLSSHLFKTKSLQLCFLVSSVQFLHFFC